MDVKLSRRLAAAFYAGGATIEERQRLIEAAEKARNFSDLPSSEQRLIVNLETRP